MDIKFTVILEEWGFASSGLALAIDEAEENNSLMMKFYMSTRLDNIASLKVQLLNKCIYSSYRPMNTIIPE